jgi:membrane protease YdiL (CAAX protease family)
VFGLFHFVNLFTGAPLEQTMFQVMHAGAMGFLYAALRLRLGAVWPLMLIHGFWDFSLFVLQSAQTEEKTGAMSLTMGLGIAVPALLYGIFVYWRWSRTSRMVL